MTVLKYNCLLFLSMLCMLDLANALKCKMGTPTLGKLTEPNQPDADCAGKPLDQHS